MEVKVPREIQSKPKEPHNQEVLSSSRFWLDLKSNSGLLLFSVQIQFSFSWFQSQRMNWPPFKCTSENVQYNVTKMITMSMTISLRENIGSSKSQTELRHGVYS